MDWTFRHWIVAAVAGAGTALAIGQPLPGAPATPTNADEAQAQYDAARARCNAQLKVARAECLRNAEDDYDRAIGIPAAPNSLSGFSGGGGGPVHPMGSINNRS